MRCLVYRFRSRSIRHPCPPKPYTLNPSPSAAPHLSAVVGLVLGGAASWVRAWRSKLPRPVRVGRLVQLPPVSRGPVGLRVVELWSASLPARRAGGARRSLLVVALHHRALEPLLHRPCARALRHSSSRCVASRRVRTTHARPRVAKPSRPRRRPRSLFARRALPLCLLSIVLPRPARGPAPARRKARRRRPSGGPKRGQMVPRRRPAHARVRLPRQ